MLFLSFKKKNMNNPRDIQVHSKYSTHMGISVYVRNKIISLILATTYQVKASKYKNVLTFEGDNLPKPPILFYNWGKFCIPYYK